MYDLSQIKGSVKNSLKIKDRIPENPYLKQVGAFVSNMREPMSGYRRKNTTLTDMEYTRFITSFMSDKISKLPLKEVEGINLRDEGERITTDANGWYVTINEQKTGRAVWVNGELLAAGEKKYLTNDDLIVLQEIEPDKTELLLFSILNQMETGWKKYEVKDNFEDDYLNRLLMVNEDGNAYIQTLDKDLLYRFHKKVPEYAKLSAYDCLVYDDRHIIFDGRYIYLQNELKEEEHEILPLMAHHFGKDDTLDIMINNKLLVRNRQQKKTLEDISLSVKPGEIVLVLGGSGAGKTTFMEAVIGKDRANGTIMLGEHDLYKEYSSFNHLIGHIPQKIDLRESESVYMILKSAAKLNLPKEVTDDERLLERRITDTLKMLDLEKERNKPASTLSGGEQKRLLIAKTYISEPAIFFVDEADSGVDSYLGEKMMKKFKEIADTGKIILIITHSPDQVAEYFDKVLVLAKSREDDCGHMAFYGTPENAKTFFDAENYRDLIRKINEDPDSYITNYKTLIAKEGENNG